MPPRNDEIQFINYVTIASTVYICFIQNLHGKKKNSRSLQHSLLRKYATAVFFSSFFTIMCVATV